MTRTIGRPAVTPRGSRRSDIDVYRAIRQKSLDVLSSVTKLDLINIYEAFHPTREECIFLLNAPGMGFKSDWVLRHNIRLNKSEIKFIKKPF